MRNFFDVELTAIVEKTTESGSRYSRRTQDYRCLLFVYRGDETLSLAVFDSGGGVSNRLLFDDGRFASRLYRLYTLGRFYTLGL